LQGELTFKALSKPKSLQIFPQFARVDNAPRFYSLSKGKAHYFRLRCLCADILEEFSRAEKLVAIADDRKEDI